MKTRIESYFLNGDVRSTYFNITECLKDLHYIKKRWPSIKNIELVLLTQNKSPKRKIIHL